MVAVTAVAPMPSMSLITMVCGAALGPVVACMLVVRISPTLVDGSVASFARAVLGPAGVVLTMVFVLLMAEVVGVSGCGGAGRVRW
jgi:hypothetical protein